MLKKLFIIILGIMCVTMVKPAKKASANSSKFITIETSKGNVLIENNAKGRKSQADLGINNSKDEIIRLTGNVVIINQKSKLSGAKGITN